MTSLKALTVPVSHEFNSAAVDLPYRLEKAICLGWGERTILQ
jgi:hypothetical protein